METLVLGTAFGYTVGHVRLFVETLRRHYDGEAGLLITSRGPAVDELISFLHSYKITPIFFDTALWMPTHIQVGRYIRYYEVLRGSTKRYDRVLFTDVTDVFFQAHPFQGAPEGDLLFFMEAPHARIGTCNSNSSWVSQVFGDSMLKRLADKPISCSGTTIGSQSAMEHYIELMLKHASPALMARLNNVRGHDQGIHNMLLHTNALAGVKAVPNGVHVLTLGQTVENDIVIASDGIRASDGTLPAIVHQYNYRPAVLDWVKKNLAI